MNVSFSGELLVVDGIEVKMPWSILSAKVCEDKVIVLLDPDSYLLNSNYKNFRRQGGCALKNLFALDCLGVKLWEADFPVPSDYYYKISSYFPLVACSFSSYRCEIDLNDGSIKKKEFLK